MQSAIYTYKRLTEAAFINVGQYPADRDLFARVTMLTTYRAASPKHRPGGNKRFPIQRTLGLSVWTVLFIASRKKTNVKISFFAFRVVPYNFLGFFSV